MMQMRLKNKSSTWLVSWCRSCRKAILGRDMWHHKEKVGVFHILCAKLVGVCNE